MNDYWLLLIGIALGVAFGLPSAYYWGKRKGWDRASEPMVPQPEALETFEEEMARAIDPKNPPTYQTYRPRDGISTLKCTCHQETVEVGAKVLLWPIPDHPEGAMDVFCERTYGQVGR